MEPFSSLPSAMIFRVVCFVVSLSVAKAQHQWPYPSFQQQIQPPPQAHQPNGPFPPGFLPIGSNGLQPFDGFPYGNRPIYNGGPPQQMFPPPRMQLLRIQLVCESVPAQQPPIIRWVRRDSSTVASTAITIAEGANAVDQNKYTVNLENLSNGVIRSVLTIVRPEPDSSQAAYNCQSVSSSTSTAESREVYVIGNRQFVNANMAYHAADTFTHITGNWQQRSAAGPATEAVKIVTPNPLYLNDLNQSGWEIYHEDETHEERNSPTHKSVQPSVVAGNHTSI